MSRTFQIPACKITTDDDFITLANISNYSTDSIETIRSFIIAIYELGMEKKMKAEKDVYEFKNARFRFYVDDEGHETFAVHVPEDEWDEMGTFLRRVREVHQKEFGGKSSQTLDETLRSENV